MAWTISGSCCNLRSDLSTWSSHEQDTRHMFDAMSTQEWRSPTRVLDITVHHACYPITEKLLHQVFSPFGAVEHVRVSRESVPVLAQVVFRSRNDAAEAFGELHGRNIYDGCCQMEIEWGVSQELDVPMVSGISMAIATSNGDATTSLSMAQLPSATGAISTINNLSSEQAPVAVSRSHINVAAAAACVNIDEVAQPVAVLDVMDHTVVDELLVPTLSTFAMDVVPFFNLAITPSATSDDRCKDIDPDAHQALDDMVLESINFHTNFASLELPIDDFPCQQKFMCGPVVIDDFLEYLARELISFTCFLEHMLVLSMSHIELTPWPPPAGFAPTSGGAELCVIPWPSLIGQESFKLWHVTSIQDTVTSHSAGQSHCHVFSHILTTEHHTICLLPVNRLKAWYISEALLLFGKVSIINYGFPSRDDKITTGEIYRPWDPGNSCCRSCIRIEKSMIRRMTIQRKLGAVTGVFLTLGTIRKNVLHLGQPGHPRVCMRKMVLHCLIIALTASCGASLLKDGSSKYHKYMSRGVMVAGCVPDAIDQQQEVLVISVFSKQLKVTRVVADPRPTPWPSFSTVDGIPASWGFHWLWKHLWPLSHRRKIRQCTSKILVVHTDLTWLQNLNLMCFGGVSDITTVLLLRILVEFQILQLEPRRDTVVLQPTPWPSFPRHDLAFQEVSGHQYARAVTTVSPFHLHNNLWKGAHKYNRKKIYVSVHKKVPCSTFWELMLAKNLQFSWDTMCATHESFIVLLAIMKTEVCLYLLKLSEEVHGLASEAAEMASDFKSMHNNNFIALPWNPGASNFLHRLEGKPKLKKGGMLGTSAHRAQAGPTI